MTHIPVNVKLRPYLTRVRNCYRNYRVLKLPPLPAFWHAVIDCARIRVRRRWWWQR